MSETNSECTGRESSLGSSEDLQDIMTLLNIQSVNLLTQDRFKVDRKQLENLLFGSDPGAASQLFQTLMKETGTHIVWPSRLKLNAKSKKDPHIRVFGRIEDVKEARNRVLSLVGAKGNRVNMKIDISYTDHSHIIGKGGLTIKRVMEETSCHIHFPDSNRSNPVEKSNQVSIAGEIAGVEKARHRVRELTPLIFGFDLPILEALTLTPDPTSPFIKNIQENYKVQVMYRTRQKLNSTLVVIKGCEWDVELVKEATKILMAHMCKSLVDHVSVHIMLEISPHHHSVVRGRNNENLKAIMANTQTQITFLDPADPNIPSIKKSNVTITGSINNVYLARQQLIGSLPVSLMFDVPENSPAVETSRMNDIMNELDVFITTRHKAKQSIITVLIKGIERNVGNIYEAQRKLINSNDAPIKPQIPSTFTIPQTTNPPIFNQLWNCNNSHPILSTMPQGLSPFLALSPLVGNSNNFWPHYHPQFMLAPSYAPPSVIQHSSCYSNLDHFCGSALSLPELPVYSSLSSNTSSISSNCASPRSGSPILHKRAEKRKPASLADDCGSKVPPGFKRPLLDPSDLQSLKHQAFQAMGNLPNPDECRIPTSMWSGYGLSQSSTAAQLYDMRQNTECDRDTNSPISTLGKSNLTEALSQNMLSSLTSLNSSALNSDLTSLLITLGLEKYARLFESHDVDLRMFRSLTEQDLKEMGVHSLGARRKLLVSIAELNKKRLSPFCGSVAPGAERKSSSNNSLHHL